MDYRIWREISRGDYDEGGGGGIYTEDKFQ